MTSQEIVERTCHVADRIAGSLGIQFDGGYADAGVSDPCAKTEIGKIWHAARIATIHWTGEDPNEHYQKLKL